MVSKDVRCAVYFRRLPAAVPVIRDGRPVTSLATGARMGAPLFVVGLGTVSVDVASPIEAGSSGAVTATVTSGSAAVNGVSVALAATGGAVLGSASGTTNASGQVTTTVTTDVRTRPGSPLSVSAASGSSTARNTYIVLGANVLGWGSGDLGVNAIGTSADALTPTQAVPVFPAPVVQVAQGGDRFTLFRLMNGEVWGVGNNSQGALADGTRNSRATPQRIPGLSGVVDIAAGYQTGYAVLQDGTVRSWGTNYESALGDGTTYAQKEFSLSVVTVSGVSNAMKVAGGSWFGLALLKDGTVRGWGQMGDGSTLSGNRYTPAAVTGISSAVSIVAASQTGYALLSDKTVVAWGDGENGELGNGASVATASPVAVQGLSNVRSIGSSYALRSDGTVWVWGANDKGQIGNGFSGSPTNVPHPGEPSRRTGCHGHRW